MFLLPEDFAIEGDKYLIPNIENGEVDYTNYIDETERDILRIILGDTLYSQFSAGIAEVSPLQKWIDLRDGDNYVYKSKSYIYSGIKKILKPYVYSEWIKDNYDNLAKLGVNVPDLENSERISPARRIVDGYNEFVKLLGPRNKKGTLYGFLKANESVNYPDWVFDEEDEIEEINVWNI